MHEFYSAEFGNRIRLHSHSELIDFFGQPGIIRRQIARWSKQYICRIATPDAREHGPTVSNGLPAKIPDDDSTSIAHGDFRCDNMIFHPQ